MSAYTPKYFKESMPEWKRKKDSIFLRIFYRRASFYFSCVFARMGVSANTVSRISILVAIAALCLFPVNTYWAKILAACMINIWLILDCADGNLARSVRRQHFGGFFDALSSYLLEGFLYIVLGISVYQTGGIFFNASSISIAIMGCFASVFIIMAKLVHQKYVNIKIQIDGYIAPVEDNDIPRDRFGKMRSFIEQTFGIAGILPIFILIATIFNALDIVILCYFAYYGVSLLIVLLVYIMRAYKYEKSNEYTKD